MVTTNQEKAQPGPGLPVADLWVRMQRGEAHAWGEWFRRHDNWVTQVLRWELWVFDAHEPERVAENFRLALMRHSFADVPATSFPRKVHELLYGVCR